MRYLLTILMVATMIGCGDEATVGKNEGLNCSSIQTGAVGSPQPCDAKWDCTGDGGGTFAIDCTHDGTNYQCQCLEDGVHQGDFSSVDVCQNGDKVRAANTGCGWNLME